MQLVPSDSLGLHNTFFRIVIRSLVLHITIQKNELCMVNRGNELQYERMIGKNYLSAGRDSYSVGMDFAILFNDLLFLSSCYLFVEKGQHS